MSGVDWEESGVIIIIIIAKLTAICMYMFVDPLHGRLKVPSEWLYFLVIQLSISMSHGWSESQEFDIQVARNQQNLAQPYFVNFRCFLNKMETRAFWCFFLRGWKIASACLFFGGGCAALMLFTTYPFKKN